MSDKTRSLSILVLSQVSALGLWFISSAILPDMLKEVSISNFGQAAMASAVSLGFVVGAIASALLGLADRFDPRKVFSISALLAALCGFLLLVTVPGGAVSIGLRFLTGAMLAGVYPVGMKIAVGWGKEDRGLLVGLLVGALTFGSASPHLVAYLGGADWRLTIAIVSALTLIGGVAMLFTSLGPFNAKAASFKFTALSEAWTNKRVRYAYLGYFGHMWELYAMWAWIGVASLASYSYSMPHDEAVSLSKLTAFFAIAIGGVTCMIGGYYADRIGKAEIAILAMWISSGSAITAALTFGSAPWLTFLVVMVWGASIIPDSPQFSALVADASPPQIAGSLMTLQTAIGFTLTFFTVQLTPLLVEATSWPSIIALMALGPIFGLYFMRKLQSVGLSLGNGFG